MQAEFALSENTNMKSLEVHQDGGNLETENLPEFSKETRNREPLMMIQPADQLSKKTRPFPGKENQLETPDQPGARVSENGDKKDQCDSTGDDKHTETSGKPQAINDPKECSEADLLLEKDSQQSTSTGAKRKSNWLTEHGEKAKSKQKEKKQSSPRMKKRSSAPRTSLNRSRKPKSTTTTKQHASEGNRTATTSERSQTGTDPISAEDTGEEKEVTVRFKWIRPKASQLMTISARANTAIIDALRTSSEFKKVKQKETQTLIISGNRMRAQYNPWVPCGALRDDEELELQLKTSSKQKPLENSSYPRYTGGHFIRVETKGETDGRKIRTIVPHDQLRKEGNPFAVFGYDRETIEVAICNDKRFANLTSFKLKGTKSGRFESHTKFGKLKGDVYNIIVDSSYGQSENPVNDAPGAAEPCNPPNNDLAEFASAPSESMKKTMEALKINLEKYVKDNGGPKKAWDSIKKLYCNHMINSPLSTYTLKLLAEHADSVGCIVARQDSNIERLGTGFLLNECLGLTCHHVVKNFLNPGFAYKPEIILQYFKKEQSIKDLQSSFPIDIVAYDEHNDYAFFRVKISPCPKLPGGLLKHVALPPVNGHVSIIGHPNCEYQLVDTDCAVINLQSRCEGMNETIACNWEHLSIFSKDNFLSYKTCFCHGSSGSPVFNDCGELVAMHQGCYSGPTLWHRQHQIEYGKSLVDILIDGAVKIEDFRSPFKEVVERNEALHKYIHSSQHPTPMQPNISQLLELWRGDESEMDTS